MFCPIFSWFYSLWSILVACYTKDLPEWLSRYLPTVSYPALLGREENWAVIPYRTIVVRMFIVPNESLISLELVPTLSVLQKYHFRTGCIAICPFSAVFVSVFYSILHSLMLQSWHYTPSWRFLWAQNYLGRKYKITRQKLAKRELCLYICTTIWRRNFKNLAEKHSGLRSRHEGFTKGCRRILHIYCVLTKQQT